MQRGDDAGALRAGELSVALVDGIEGGRIPTMARVRFAVTRRELGASAEDTEALVADAGGWELALVPPTWRVLWAETLTRVELAAGRAEQAEASARLAEDTAESFPLPLAGALARRARARMLFASGAAGAARDLATDAAARAASAGAPVEAARARVVAGLAAAWWRIATRRSLPCARPRPASTAAGPSATAPRFAATCAGSGRDGSPEAGRARRPAGSTRSRAGSGRSRTSSPTARPIGRWPRICS